MTENGAGVSEISANKTITPRYARRDIFDWAVLPHFCTKFSSVWCNVLLIWRANIGNRACSCVAEFG
jgi:hypothetical protein